MLTMLQSPKYSFRNPKKHNLSNLPHQTAEKLQKTMGSSEDPSLVNNVDELGLVYQGLNIRTSLALKHTKKHFYILY